MEQWPRTHMAANAEGPARLELEIVMAAERVVGAMSTRPTDATWSYSEALASVGSPPDTLRHPTDTDEHESIARLARLESECSSAQWRVDSLVQMMRIRGESVLERCTREVVRGLRSLTESTISGSESGLANVWEEVCVQVQGEESVLWDAYLDTIEQFASGFVSDLPDDERLCLWLRTPAGEAWSAGDDIRNGEGVPILESDCDAIISERVLTKAADWTNVRIRRYIERSMIMD